MAGNEVTTGSTSLENLYEESVDYDKHRDKKKKKKKKEDRDRSNPGSPIDEKKKKKVWFEISNSQRIVCMAGLVHKRFISLVGKIAMTDMVLFIRPLET